MNEIKDIKRSVDALASLIQRHYQRTHAYLNLAEARSRDEIKSVCMYQVDVSMQMINNLSKWRSAYGGFAKNLDRRDSADIWHEARLFLSLNREKAMIRRCEKLDKEILKLYQLAIPLMPSAAAGDLQLQAKTLEPMIVRLQETSEQKQIVGAFATR